MSAIITFDDGLQTTYDVAYPIMKDHGMIGVSFVCGYWITHGCWQKRPTMTFQQINELRNSGWEIANHSFQHRNPDRISSNDLQTDILKGKLWIEDEIGVIPVSYAYPFCKTVGVQYATKMHKYCRACRNEQSPLWDRKISDKIPSIPRDLKSQDTTNLYWINRAKQEGKIVVFVIHNIEDKPKSTWDIRTKDFRLLILDLYESRINVTTFKDMRLD